MERSIALKKLGKLLGKSFGYRINPKAPTVEERALARAELPLARVERDRLKEQKTARYMAVLAADQEYQALKSAHKAADDRVAVLASATQSYRITVGKTVMGMFFEVKAQGDSWEEVIGKVTKKETA